MLALRGWKKQSWSLLPHVSKLPTIFIMSTYQNAKVVSAAPTKIGEKVIAMMECHSRTFSQGPLRVSTMAYGPSVRMNPSLVLRSQRSRKRSTFKKLENNAY